ncbi:MAG: hypothetical protein ACLFWB_06200 [Armatimonadota bacterium]
MQAGFFDRIITPPVGYEMPGSFRKRFSEGVLEDLRARCAYLKSADDELAIVSVDCVSFDAALALRARQIIAEHTDIPAHHVLIAATHTHTGGPTAEVLMSEADEFYVRWVAEQVATAVIEARQRAQEAAIGWGMTEVPGIAHNRRWHLGDGTVQTNPGNRPDLVEPAGPVDDELIVIGVQDTQGNVMGVIPNFTCHSTFIGGRRYSADYPGFLANELGVPTVFINGAMGDINQIDFTDPDGNYSGEEAATDAAQKLAASVQKILSDVQWHDGVSLAAASQTIEMQLRGPSPDALKDARELLQAAGEQMDTEAIYARELVLLDEMIQRDGDVSDCEIQALRVGDVLISAAPLQPFCSLGLDIKDSQTSPTMISSMANGCLGYLGPMAAYEEGGYELELKRTSRLAPGSGERYVEGAIATLSSV